MYAFIFLLFRFYLHHTFILSFWSMCESELNPIPSFAFCFCFFSLLRWREIHISSDSMDSLHWFQPLIRCTANSIVSSTFGGLKFFLFFCSSFYYFFFPVVILIWIWWFVFVFCVLLFSSVYFLVNVSLGLIIFDTLNTQQL